MIALMPGGMRAYSELGGLLERIEENRRRRPSKLERIRRQPWWRTVRITLTWTGLVGISVLLLGAALIASSSKLPARVTEPTPAPTPLPCVAAPQIGQLLPVCHEAG